MSNLEEIIRRLVKGEVRFVLIGGLAAVVHGSAYVTYDVDICYQRTKDNMAKLVKVLKGIRAKLRGVPQDLPFQMDVRSISNGTNFTFTTQFGSLDILGEVAGVGTCEMAKKVSEPCNLFGLMVDVLTIDGLLAAKRAANRPKDQGHIQELQAIREIKKKDTFPEKPR